MLLPTGVSKRGFEVQTNCSLDLRGRASWCVAHLVSDQLQNWRNSPKIGQIFAYIYHIYIYHHISLTRMNILSGWWFEPPWKMMEFVSWDYSSQYMESHKVHVPNHQPVIYRWFSMIFMFNLQLVRRFSSHVWWHRRYSFNYLFSGGTYHSMVTSMAGSGHHAAAPPSPSTPLVAASFGAAWQLQGAAPRGAANGSFCG
jgi:hypothetical protein